MAADAMTPTLEAPTRSIENASQKVFSALFSGANGENETFARTLLNEKGPDKELAFKLFTGQTRTGLVSVETIIEGISRILPQDLKNKQIVLDGYLESKPNDTSLIALMESFKDSNPEFLAKVLLSNKEWTKADIRRHLSKYMLTEKLWLILGEAEEDLKSRKEK